MQYSLVLTSIMMFTRTWSSSPGSIQPVVLDRLGLFSQYSVGYMIDKKAGVCRPQISILGYVQWVYIRCL